MTANNNVSQLLPITAVASLTSAIVLLLTGRFAYPYNLFGLDESLSLSCCSMRDDSWASWLHTSHVANVRHHCSILWTAGTQYNITNCRVMLRILIVSS